MTGPAPALSPSWRVACLGATPAAAAALAAAVASVAPGALVEVVDFRSTSGTPEADLFVIDATGGAGVAVEQLAVLRARGAGAPAVLVGDAVAGVPASLGEHRVVAPGALATGLPNAIRAVAEAAAGAGDPGLAALLEGVRRTRQLVAAGELARRVKHDINNPLAALLAEAQLLELEDLDVPAREAVARIVELTRRVIEEARRLEGPRGDAPAGVARDDPGRREG